MGKKPKDIEVRAIFEPDMDRMVKALRILLKWEPERKKEAEQERVKDEKTA